LSPPCIGHSRTSKIVKTSSKCCTMVQYLAPLRYVTGIQIPSAPFRLTDLKRRSPAIPRAHRPCLLQVKYLSSASFKLEKLTICSKHALPSRSDDVDQCIAILALWTRTPPCNLSSEGAFMTLLQRSTLLTPHCPRIQSGRKGSRESLPQNILHYLGVKARDSNGLVGVGN
jgi:hypothetical protein